MADQSSARHTILTPLFRAAAAMLLVLAATTAVSAETLMMPKRDGLKGTPLIIWGITTLATHTPAAPTTYTIDFGDSSSTVGNVTDRSYITASHGYSAAGTYTATLTVVRGATTETATVQIRIVDPAALGGSGTFTSPVGPGSHEVYRNLRINMAIQDGLRYLWTSQTSRAANILSTQTSWASSQPFTALVVTAFENHGYRLTNDNVAPTGLYEKYIVQRGLNFIIASTTFATLTQQASGFAGQPVRNPCVGVGIEPSPCTGVLPTAGSPGYTLGIAMLPLAASGALNRVNGAIGTPIIQNKSYKEILQRMSNTLSHGQIDGNNAHRGGWGYGMNDGTLDGSVMGWVILGFLDAEAGGVVVPAWVKTELTFGITGAWNTNGSFDYNADGNPASHVYSGMEKAGIGLQGMFLGGEVGGARVTTTAGYISNRWNVAGRLAPDSAYWNCGANNNKSCAYSMFNNFKGLKLQGISTLPGVARAAGPGGIVANDWHADYQDWFVNNQQTPNTTAGGFWNMTFSNFGGDTNANVGLAELILSPVALVLPDADKFASVGLTPGSHTLVEGGTHTVTAKAESQTGTPVAGATVNFSILTGPNAGRTGTGTTNAAGQVTFTYTDAGPIPSYGTDRIQASIGTLLSNIAEMIWTPFNRPPVANNDAYATNEDNLLNGNVQAGAGADTDPDGDTLAATVVSGPSNGGLVLNPDGTFIYTPNLNFFGSDSFTYELYDGMLTSNIATVSITVNAVNDAPVANDASNTTAEDAAVSGVVTSSDIDGGAPSYSLGTGPANGNAVVNGDGSYTYTPALNFCGTDSFTFDVTDGLATDSGAVTITVSCVNDAPVAADASNTTAEEAAVSGVVTSSDVDGGAPSYSLGTGPANGNAVVNGDGSYTYTPALNFCGSDSFTFDVTDGLATDSGVVTITVSCVNDAPVAADASNTTAEEAAVSGVVTSSDVDGGAPSYSLGTGPANGNAVVNGDGSYTYTPALNFCGTDSFTFNVSDGAAGDAGTVTIVVSCVNDAPVAADNSHVTLEDTAVSGNASSTDVDGGAPTYSVTSQPTHGSLAFNPNGSYTYTPSTNYNGPDAFEFRVSDGAGGTDIGRVTLSVLAVNDLPVCTAAAPSITSIWPPNHQLVNVTIGGVVDPVEGSGITIKVTGIFQDEPTNTVGDGNTPIDGYGVGTSTAQVRAERSGNKKVPGDGRVYHIFFSGTDAQGGVCTGVVRVGVPHDQGGNAIPTDGGPIYKSTGS